MRSKEMNHRCLNSPDMLPHIFVLSWVSFSNGAEPTWWTTAAVKIARRAEVLINNLFIVLSASLLACAKLLFGFCEDPEDEDSNSLFLSRWRVVSAWIAERKRAFLSTRSGSLRCKLAPPTHVDCGLRNRSKQAPNLLRVSRVDRQGKG